MKTVKQILECAADHLERVGLNKGAFLGPAFVNENDETLLPLDQRSCCALGAVRVCAGVYSAKTSDEGKDANASWATASDLLGDVLKAKYGAPSVPAWNDAPERSKEDVVALLRAAAEVAPDTVAP